MTNHQEKKKIYIYDLVALKGTGKTQIKHTGYSNTEDYRDGEILVNGNTNTKEIEKNVYARFYKSKLTAEYLQSNKKISFMYVSLFYQKKFVTGHLLNIVIYFDISTDTKEFSSFDDLLKAHLDGKYIMEIDVGEIKKSFDMDNVNGEDDAVSQVLTILESNVMKDIIKKEMKKRDEERIEKYGRMVSDMPKTPKYKFNDLVEMYKKDGDLDRIKKLLN